MIKTLTTVGNSKAVILPSVLVKRYNLKKVTIEATEEGILIRPLETKTSFQRKMELARKNKKAIYKKMEREANDLKTVAFYANPNNTFEDIDLDIVES
jgi:antitoxin component of MazEF toxin-antitoxin module